MVGVGVTLFAGLTMVSNVPYYSFKTINLKKSVPFLAIFVFVLIIALVSYQPALVLFAGFVGYGLSGYVGRRGCGEAPPAAAGPGQVGTDHATRSARRPTGAWASPVRRNPLRRLRFSGYSAVAMSSDRIHGRPALPARPPLRPPAAASAAPRAQIKPPSLPSSARVVHEDGRVVDPVPEQHP